MAQEYKIPQKIDIEDKILGPFTLKQFLYMIGGGITIYFLFLVFGTTNFIVFIAISIPIALLVLALVFIQVNGRNFIQFIQYFALFVFDVKNKKLIHIKNYLEKI